MDETRLALIKAFLAAGGCQESEYELTHYKDGSVHVFIPDIDECYGGQFFFKKDFTIPDHVLSHMLYQQDLESEKAERHDN